MVEDRRLCAPYRILLLLAVLAGVATPAAGQATAIDVFSRFAPAVAKVEVVEVLSSAPQSVGTAFFVEPSLLVSNFHVVRDAIYDPSSFHLRVILGEGEVVLENAQVLAVDPVHDLSIIQVEHTSDLTLAFATQSIAVGEELYSLGHPADLRTAVVEGIYNGVVEHSASPRFHFTGSINPGMSGGPTLTRDGAVVGINVSTAGNQLSFLIPGAAAVELLGEAKANPRADRDALIAQIGERLLQFQEQFYAKILSEPLPTTTIGSLQVPSGPAEQFDCSASPHDTDDEPYEVIEYNCYTEDRVLLGPDGSYSLINLETMYVASEDLGAWRFTALVNSWYEPVVAWETPEAEAATDYGCRRDNVEAASGLVVKVVFCARRHARYDGVLDVFIRTVVVGEGREAGGREAVVGTYRATAVSFANATRFLARLVEAHAWVQ